MFAWTKRLLLTASLLALITTNILTLTTAAVSALLSLIGGVQAWVAIKESTPTVIDSVPIYTPVLWLVMMPVILVPGIVISLYFMWSIRHPNTE